MSLIALASLVLASAGPAGAEATTRTVTIEGMKFVPETVTVQRGDRVVWINHDVLPHTVTATGGAFDSHEIAADASWTLEARAAGNFPYFCTLHTIMTGRLVVQ